MSSPMSLAAASSPAPSRPVRRASMRSSRSTKDWSSSFALPRAVGRDPDDEAVIACALAAHADLIVSGDHDLRVLKIYQHIRIVNAPEALRIIAKP